MYCPGCGQEVRKVKKSSGGIEWLCGFCNIVWGIQPVGIMAEVDEDQMQRFNEMVAECRGEP